MGDSKAQVEKWLSSNEKLNRKVSEPEPRKRTSSYNRASSKDNDPKSKVERWLSSNSVDANFKHEKRFEKNKDDKTNLHHQQSYSRDLPPIEKQVKLEKKLSTNTRPKSIELDESSKKPIQLANSLDLGNKTNSELKINEKPLELSENGKFEGEKVNLETNQVTLTFESENDVFKPDIILTSTIKEPNEKNLNSNIILTVTTTTDKDSKELIKQPSTSDKDRTAVNSAKKHILQSWLKDYRRLASKSPSTQKRNKVKYTSDTNPVANDIMNEDVESDKKTIKKRRKLSKKEIEFRRQKSKSYQRKIVGLSIAIAVVIVVILAITIGLLLNYLVFNIKPTISTSSCQNTCPGNYNITLLNGMCTCSDVNECMSSLLNNCSLSSQICLNTMGSYKCYCKNGYKLDTDNITCVDINECNFNICDPSRTIGCTNMPGSYICNCLPGFVYSFELKLCVDYDECLNPNGTGSSGICAENKTCINTIGSFFCNCSVGFEPINLNNRTVCKDVNECSLNSPLYACPYPYTCQTNYNGDWNCCQNNICQACGQPYVAPLARIIGYNS